MREAHREAVNVALNELERYTQARIGGNHVAETTGQFVAAKFEHDTARPVDGYAAPQLHTHTVIFNMTEREDGSTRALQPQGLFDSQQFATAVYQSQLTYQLRNLGYEIEAGRSGAPEIKGYSQEYLDASSPRSQQIREHLERTGYQGPEAAQIAAHSTRDKKEIHTPAEVLAAHRQIAAEFGNQADKVVAEARQRVHGQAEKRSPDTPELRAREAVTYARDRSFEREAVTDERDIFRDALRRGMGETTYPQVRANFEARVASGEFQAVLGQKHETGRQFTTHDTIQAEHDVIRQMQQGQNQAPQIMPIQDAIALTDTRQQLNTAQRSAIEQILTSRDSIQGLQGVAGGGKTTTLDSIREGAEQRGYAWKASPPPRAPRTNSAMREFQPIPCKAFLPVATRETTPTADTCIWSMNPASPARNRCGTSSKRLARRTVCCLSETHDSIRGWMPESPSSSCNRPGCARPNSTRLCARRIPNC